MGSGHETTNRSVNRLSTWLHDMALFHWVVQYQDCGLGTTKKLLNGHQTLFLVRGWGLGVRPLASKINSYNLSPEQKLFADILTGCNA